MIDLLKCEFGGFKTTGLDGEIIISSVFNSYIIVLATMHLLLFY